MPELALYDKHGEKVGQVEAADEMFASPCNPDLLHQAVVTIDDHRRQVSARTLTRGEVRLTKAKWYRQKGTGRARHGAQSAPIFVGGGVAHGPKGVRRSLRMNRRMKRQALAGAFTQKVHEGAVVIVDAVEMDEISTKAFVAMLEDLEAEGRTLMLLGPDEARDEKIYKSGRNIPRLIMREAPHINARDVLWAETIIISQAGLQALTGRAGEDA
ncbi:MAG: 50S ribosomal protein L4 [Armatimonadetes bacterium]|nr:50S ribosomal protein L4 [Armatimonadota bacterium]